MVFADLLLLSPFFTHLRLTRLSDACEKAATLNGKNLLGRPIRIDWAE